MEKYLSQKNELKSKMGAKTNKEYFSYKFATLMSAFLVFFNFHQSWNFIIGSLNPPKIILYLSLSLLFITFILMLVHLTQFLIPMATLDDKCFSIKKATLRRTKRILLKGITDIRYDNWENFLHITYTQDAQQMSDKFSINSLFYEDTRRWLLLDLGEALKNYGITLRYGK